MEKVDIGSSDYTEVYAIDEPGAGGAHHVYKVIRSGNGIDTPPFAEINFQQGPLENVNGCSNKDLLAVVIHCLRSYQSGDLGCRENALAITKLEEALHWLNHRTADRKKRGVLGISAK